MMQIERQGNNIQVNMQSKVQFETKNATCHACSFIERLRLGASIVLQPLSHICRLYSTLGGQFSITFLFTVPFSSSFLTRLKTLAYLQQTLAYPVHSIQFFQIVNVEYRFSHNEKLRPC